MGICMDINRKVRIKYKWPRCIACLIMVFLVVITRTSFLSYASSASVNLTTKNSTVAVGDDVVVTLSIEADDTIGNFEAFISYHEDMFEFQSGGPFINGDDGLLKISDLSPSDEETSKKYIIKFKAVKVGSSEIAIKDRAMIFNYDDGLEMSVSTKKLSLVVKPSATASKNANLQLLKVSPSSLSPSFDKNITSYKLDVSSEVTKLIVSGVAEDNKSTITVLGEDKLVVGENVVKIIVTAESGDKKEYTIIVTKGLDMVEDTTLDDSTDEGDIEEDYNDSTELIDKFKVSNEDGIIFIENSYEYQVLEPEMDIDIPAGYIKTKLILYGVQITAYTLESDLESDFLLIYAKGEDSEEGFYQYDRVEKTLQRHANLSSSNNNTIHDSSIAMTSDQYKNKLEQLSVIIALFSAFSALLILLVIRLYMKLKGYKNDDLD